MDSLKNFIKDCFGFKCHSIPQCLQERLFSLLKKSNIKNFELRKTEYLYKDERIPHPIRMIKEDGYVPVSAITDLEQTKSLKVGDLLSITINNPNLRTLQVDTSGCSYKMDQTILWNTPHDQSVFDGFITQDFLDDFQNGGWTMQAISKLSSRTNINKDQVSTQAMRKDLSSFDHSKSKYGTFELMYISHLSNDIGTWSEQDQKHSQTKISKDFVREKRYHNEIDNSIENIQQGDIIFFQPHQTTGRKKLYLRVGDTYFSMSNTSQNDFHDLYSGYVSEELYNKLYDNDFSYELLQYSNQQLSMELYRKEE